MMRFMIGLSLLLYCQSTILNMIEKLFQTILAKYLGQFLTGLENAQVQLWSGKIQLHNISFKHQKINQILKQKNIPFCIKYSHIGQLSIDIPWKSLSKTPVQVKISGVYVVMKMQKYTSVAKKIEQQKLSLIKNYIEHIIKKALDDTTKNNDDGYMKKMLIKIIHNLNADIKDISIRIVSQSQHKFKSAKKGEMDEQSVEGSMMSSFRPQTQFVNNHQSLNSYRKPSQTNSEGISKKQKSFAFGFCIHSFNIQTVDQNFNRTFYNSDNKKSPVRKIITMQHISTYLQQQNTLNIFKVSQQNKIEFMQSVILREKHRLLSIDGRIIVDLNAQKEKFYDYFLTLHLENLEIKSTYGQLREIIKIIANFQTASGAKQIKKLSEVDEIKQLEFKPQFIAYFPQINNKKFSINSTIDPKLSQILCSVSKKNLLSWTKQCTVQLIKQTKVEKVRKQKNKKTWLGYIMAQAEVVLTQQQINQIYLQVEQIIKSIDYDKKMSIKVQTILQKITFLISHQQLEQYLSLQLQKTHINYSNSQTSDLDVAVSIANITLPYTNNRQNIKISLLARPVHHLETSLIQFSFSRSDINRKIRLHLAELEINHEMRVLMLINQLIKLKTKQQMQSDVVLKRAQIASQGRNIEEQLGKKYEIMINIQKIVFKIQVNQNAYILISNEGIDVNTTKDDGYHEGILKNLNICYITASKKSAQKQKLHPHILKDLTIDFKISPFINKIYTKIEILEIFVCESDLHSIYRSFQKQRQIFKSQKVEQKNKTIHEYSYMKGQLRLLNVMKSWKDYEGVLTDEGLYFFQSQIFDDQQKSTQSSQKYAHMIPINNCFVTVINQQQFKLQSNQVKELIECSPEQLSQWVEIIQKLVFQNSSKAKMYKLIDAEDEKNDKSTIFQQNEKNYIKYQKQIIFQFDRIQILISQNKQKNLMRFCCIQTIIGLRQNQLQFERTISIDEVIIKKLDTAHQSQFNNILKTKKEQQFLPIKVQIQGKKKLHPEYKGELSIKLVIPFIKLNYDPQFIYKMIKKIAWGHEIPSYTNQMRNTKVLQIVKQFLRSSTYEKRQRQLNSPNCKTLQNHDQYLEINRYKALGHTCLVLLSVKGSVQQVQINFINGINSMCMFNAKASSIQFALDKGSQFMFFKLNALSVQLYDVTGYPHTNTKPNKIQSYYPIISRKAIQNRQSKQGVECIFSRFDIDRFINKDRFKTFFQLDIYDAQLNFQNQLINRFFDYLFNQIIAFILAPNSLHKYDGPRRGPFLYDNNINMTQKQVRDIISDAIQPFFVKMFINAYNLTVKFNSFPALEGFNLDFQSMKIQSFNYEKSEKIRFNISELNKIEKHPVFKQLIKIAGFQEKLLKSHWVSRLDIVVQGVKSIIFATQVPKVHTYLQRTLNSQKQILFPFVSLDTSMILQSVAKNLPVKALRQIYNLINKCMMHNLSYDDQQDALFTYNFQFRSYMKVSEIFYRLQADELQIVIPELKTVVAIPDFCYTFIRQVNFSKVMTVEGRSFNIFQNNQIIMMLNDSKTSKQVSALSFKIDMKTNGDKDMIVKINWTDIHYNLDFFLKFVQYTILDQSCYPPLPQGTVVSQLPDLPLIKCLVVLENSRIKLLIPNTEDDQFILSGLISLVWVRNSLIHPQKYATNPSNFPNGKQWCNYRIQVKDMNIRKHYKVKNTNNQVTKSGYTNANVQKNKYRLIGSQISLIFKISQLMKLASNQIDRYNDNQFQVKVNSLSFKLCYVDIEDLKSCFVKKQPLPQVKPIKKIQMEESQSQIIEAELHRMESSQSQMQPQPAAKPASYKSYTKYQIQIHRIQIQLGLSQLPVPLVDFTIKSTKSSLQLMGDNTTVTLKTSIVANCWNMLIGRWEPIIEELSPTMNCKLGKDKYLLFDCNQKLLFNISLESLKILKLISKDFSQKGNFSISQIFNKQTSNQQNEDNNKVKGINVSPYVLTNRTGVPISVYNQAANTKIKLKPQQKIYVDLKNYQLDFAQKTKVIFEFDESSQKIQVNMDLATTKKITVKYKKRQYELLLRPISNSIMKQIIVSSLFVIQNKTRYGVTFYYNYGVDQDDKDTYEGKINIMPKQKTALKFTANIKNLSFKQPQKSQKNLKLQFPSLQKNEIKNNYEFPYQALEKDYEHQIDMSKNRTFNSVISLHEDIYNEITIEPSFYVKNLLPVDLHIEFVVQRDGEKVIFSQGISVNQEKDMYDFNSKEVLQARMKIKGFNISPFQKITNSSKDLQQINTYLDLIDYRGHSGKISIKILKKNKVRKMYIFSSAILINETKYDWYAFSSSKLMPGQKIAGVPESQTIYTFINASQYVNLNFGFADDNPFNSNQFKISQLGIHDISMYKATSLYEFTVKCNFHCLDNDALIYSYVIKAQPKYIVVNDTSCQLELSQTNTENKSVFAKPGERLNWIWPVRTQAKSIIARICSNQNDDQIAQWHYSSPMMITSQDIQQTIFVLHPKKQKNQTKKLLKLIPIKQNQSTYLIIEQLKKPEDYLITINNEIDYCKLRVYQQCVDQKDPSWKDSKYFQVGPKHIAPFGWDYPYQQQKIVCEIAFLGYLRTKFEAQSFEIGLQSQKVEQITITNSDNETQQIIIKVQIIGLRKKVTICKKQNYQQQDPESEMMHTGNRSAFSFTEIGVSVISSVKKRSQLLFLNLKKVEIIMMEKKSSRSLQVKIKYINIDNNFNHNTVYPILLTPLKHNKTLQKSRPFFVLLLQQTLDSKDITQIKQFRICNQPISIKIHDQVLTAVFEMIQELNKETDSSQERIDLLAIYRSYFNYMEWQDSKLIKPQRDIFFREIQIAKLALEITFSIRPKLNTNNFIIMTILSSFGAAISNVSEAQLTLSRFLKRDKGLSQLKSELSDFYFKQFVKGIYKVLGSINLFGNPYVFIRMLSEGAWEIVNQPTEGFIKGPIQGAIGIVKGGVFFTRNVVAGSCNSFQAISQSISRGVAYLTMDQKFIERRQKIKIQKSNHFFKGLYYGGFSIYTGVQVAITGLVRHPVEGYQQSGFLGGVTGTLKGVAGLVTKPISGTFQGISKVSQGIKNTALLFQDGPNSKRMRPPRIFLSQLSYYKNYNVYESTAIQTLQYISTRYLNEQINYICISQHEKTVEAFVMTGKFFTHVDLLSRKIISELQIADIREVNIEPQAKSVRFNTGRDFLVVIDENYQQMFQMYQKYYTPQN